MIPGLEDGGCISSLPVSGGPWRNAKRTLRSSGMRSRTAQTIFATRCRSSLIHDLEEGWTTDTLLDCYSVVSHWGNWVSALRDIPSHSSSTTRRMATFRCAESNRIFPMLGDTTRYTQSNILHLSCCVQVLNAHVILGAISWAFEGRDIMTYFGASAR